MTSMDDINTPESDRMMMPPTPESLSSFKIIKCNDDGDESMLFINSIMPLSSSAAAAAISSEPPSENCMDLENQEHEHIGYNESAASCCNSTRTAQDGMQRDAYVCKNAYNNQEESECDPIFEFGETQRRACSSVSLGHLVIGCVGLLFLGLFGGGLALVGKAARTSGNDLIFSPDNNSSSGTNHSMTDTPFHNITWWDCGDATYYEYFLRKTARRITNRTALITPGTPQYQALSWITKTDAKFQCPYNSIDVVVQRYLLGLFYFTTKGNHWYRCKAPKYFFSERSVGHANSQCDPLESRGGDRVNAVNTNNEKDAKVALAWLTGSECNWGGITCNKHGQVIAIDIENYNLAGTIPPELKHLSSLRVLSLKIGQLSGSIHPALGAMSLEHLDLEFNLLRGSIPSSLYRLANVTSLDLSNNMLSGTVSDSIQSLKQLQSLRLDNNYLTGSIPRELTSLADLETIAVHFNDFSGSIPGELCVGGNKLVELTADCRQRPNGRTTSPFIDCPCCSFCY